MKSMLKIVMDHQSRHPNLDLVILPSFVCLDKLDILCRELRSLKLPWNLLPSQRGHLFYGVDKKCVRRLSLSDPPYFL